MAQAGESMPTAKGKGAPASHRYRPAAEYDDATLAQKREYWRNKKREQRARLSERRGRPRAAQDRQGKKLLHLNASAGTYSGLCSFAALASPLQSNDDSYNSASQSGRAAEGGCALAAAESRNWLETVSDNGVSPQPPVSCSVSARAAGRDAATATLPTARGAASGAVTSPPTPSGTQLDTSSLVPPVGVARIANGGSATAASQPCVSMQGAPDPKIQQKAQVVLPIEQKLGAILASSPLCPVSAPEDEATNATPQSCAKRAKGAPESEEEKAAKRREHWRIKKREQRAKLAAQIVKTRERAQGVEMYQRLTSQKAGLVGRSVLLPSQSLSRGVGRKQCPARVKAAFTSGKRENGKVQCDAATAAMPNTDQIQNSHGNNLTDVTADPSVKKSADPHRRLSNYVHLYNATRGIARCKTPRQRLIDVQKIFMNQRSLRCKSFLASPSAFGTRGMPKIDPNDTPEQIVAKRREYWRMKKREQRAKLSSEVRVRLKEKDSVTRRVKRYQKILEDMRRARAMTHSPASVLTHSPASVLTHASETIGGFIKEDGTLTSNIPLGPAEHNVADGMSEEELRIASKYNSIRQQQNQPHGKRRGVAPPVRINQPPPPPPLRLAQVRVAFPLAGKSANKPQRLLSIRPRTQLERTPGPSESQTVTLTHPQTLQSAALDEPGSKQGGCVMKLAVSSGGETSPSAPLSLDPGLTEEERMAKKREYWRVKKREQRAARAVRLKQGVLQARAGSSLQRRRAQKQVAAAAAVQLSRGLSGRSGKAPPLSNKNEAGMPLANDVKQERESVPAVDLNCRPEQAICDGIDPPVSPPPPPPEPQPELDPALNADSQATTLLAVASMKKLLEESLSTVTECKNEQTDVTMSAAEEQDAKPNLPQLFFDKDDLVPITADLTLQIKSWQTDSDVSADSLSQELRNSPQAGGKSPPPFPASDDDAGLNPTCEHASQTPLNFIVNPSAEAFGGSLSSSPPATRRVSLKNEDLQNRRSPEPPELHDDAATYLDQLEPRPCQTEEGCQSNVSPSAQSCHGAAAEKLGSAASLQSKREYWKLMKRQQRARLKARHEDRHGDCSGGHLPPRNLQGSELLINPAHKAASLPAKPALRPKPPGAPSGPVVHRDRSADPFRDVRSRESSPASPRLSREWTPGNADLDLDPAPSPPTLQPPDNPLSSINLQPIEPPAQSPGAAAAAAAAPSPIKIPATQSPTDPEPLSNVAPPKPIPGEPEEDFLRRKREYWRIKKKEQRARKASRGKGGSARRGCSSWRPILPTHDLQTQESGQWVNSPEEPEQPMRTSVDTDPGSFTYANYSTPVGDDSEIIFADYESHPGGEDGPVSDAAWRTRYLMDYDPLNQLLVCMVCGELQYSHGLEGVRLHIDEAHPHTLTLEPAEKQRILEAWDEQVSQRERFFTSQLQQHGGALADWRPVQDAPQDGPHLSPSDIGDRLQPPDAP